MILRNVGTQLPVYTVPSSRKPEYETVGPKAGYPDILRGFMKENAGKVHLSPSPFVMHNRSSKSALYEINS